MKAFRFFWLALFVIMGAIASFLAEETFFPLRAPFQKGSLEALVNDDLNQLEKTNQLSADLKNVNQVFIVDRRESDKDKNKKEIVTNWPELSKIHFPQKKDGKYDLQIEVFTDQESNQKPSDSEMVILQFSLFEKDTKNKIWELSRSYPTQNKKSQ
jgi:hypothetical protein